MDPGAVCAEQPLGVPDEDKEVLAEIDAFLAPVDGPRNVVLNVNAGDRCLHATAAVVSAIADYMATTRIPDCVVYLPTVCRCRAFVEAVGIAVTMRRPSVARIDRPNPYSLFVTRVDGTMAILNAVNLNNPNASRSHGAELIFVIGAEGMSEAIEIGPLMNFMWGARLIFVSATGWIPDYVKGKPGVVTVKLQAAEA